MRNKGIQVLITSYNSAKYLNRCLNSIEKALKGYHWILIFCDDDSQDETESIIKKYILNSSAQHCIYKKFTKADTVGEAKNRTFKLCLEHVIEFPILCPMDADDKMGEKRISTLLPHVNESSPIVYGDYIINHLSDDTTQYISAESPILQNHLVFAWWATLIHYSLIPEDGGFFREDLFVHEEILKWWELKYKDNINIKPISGEPVHYYNYIVENSITAKSSEKDLDILKIEKEKIHPIPH